MFSEPLSAFAGRPVPRAESMSTLLMLPLSLKYTYPAPVPPSTTMPAAVQAVIMRPLWRLLRGLRRRPLARPRGPSVPGPSGMPGPGLLSADMCSSVLVPVGYPLVPGTGLSVRVVLLHRHSVRSDGGTRERVAQRSVPRPWRPGHRTSHHLRVY